MFRNLYVGALAILFAVGCSDLSTEPEQSPAEIQLSRETVTATAGQDVDLQVTVLDSRGNPISNVPEWATVRWTSSEPAVVSAEGSKLKAVNPGQTTVTANLAGLQKTALVRVNPTSVRLEIGLVTLTQADNAANFLQPGIDATLRVFLVADGVNFFQPKVRVTLLRGGQVVSTLTLERNAPSIPLYVNAFDPDAAWTATIPGELVQPGLQLVIEADPEQTVPRAAGSIDRYPAGGAFTVAVGEAAIQLTVAGAYMTQSVQRFNGTVPLIQGRNALLRVFLTADDTNTNRPPVLARFYRNGAIVHEVTMTSDAPSVPRVVEEGMLSLSWNATIPGAVLQPGVSLVVQADPNGTVPLKPESSPRLPATGELALDVRATPSLLLRMVPITQTTHGTTGNITAANLQQYVRAAYSKFPLGTVDADIRSTPMFTSASASTESGWSQILMEMRALQEAEGGRRYYYGVLRHPGGVGIAGIAYRPGRAGIGWDNATQGPETFAHELGHNFNLMHAPCGGPSGVDGNYPSTGAYVNAGIGVYGYDITTGALKLPTEKDLMSYCSPAWISDYHYDKVLVYRNQADWSTVTPRVAQQNALLVWGGVSGGRLVLEPAFELEMVPSPPSAAGPYQVRGLDRAGNTLFSYRFDVAEVDDLTGAKGFAFAVPPAAARADLLWEIVLTGPEGEVRQRRASAVASAPRTSTRPGIQGRELTWDATDHPMALIRDARTGEILSFARGGRSPVSGRVVDVLYSDGVRSTRQTVDLR